jgi:hypothetical protein
MAFLSLKNILGLSSAFALVLITACGSGSGGQSSVSDPPPPGSPSPPPPPPPADGGSTAAIAGVTFDAASHRREAQGSDNWPLTWSDDDNQYAIWGDGGGFGGTESDGRASLGVARIEGDGEDYRGVNRYGGVSGECQSSIDGKAHGAPLSVGGVLYAWITPASGAAGYDQFTLHRSNDKGCAWTRLDVTFTQARDHISYGSFVQFGKNNGAAPDAYLYTVATEVADTSSLDIVQRPGRVMLVRVPAIAIEDRGAYEFFAGLDSTGQPEWSADPANRFAIYEDSDGVGPFPQMTFVPGLERMVYTNQHGSGSGSEATQSLLTMAEAPQPWGPWTVFFHDRFAPELEHSVFQWSFAPKWFRNGGLEFTLVFSGTGSNDSWNTIDGAFTTQ